MNLHPTRSLTLAAALSLATLASAGAAEYTVLDPETSRINFGYSQMNVKMEGSFDQLRATEFSFDPERPEAARVALEVAVASIDAGYDEANEELKKEEWLALTSHPLATSTSRQVQALEDGSYQVTGELSIKGRSQEVTVPFTFEEAGESGIFEGGFTFQRADFGVGDGQWKDFSIVANDIQIEFRVIARR